MPGLFGFFLKEPNDVNMNKSLLKQMAEKLQHKENYIIDTFIDSKVGLGRVSLGIFNKTSQPVSYKECLLYMDGHVDNLAELKSLLQHKTNSDLSDEELILHLFLLYKTDLPQLLKGIFNIIIYDSNENKLYIFCNRYGVLPLYFTVTSKGFYFAPEIKALMCIPELDKTLNKQALINFLTAGLFLGEETLFEKISLFPYGTQFIIDSKLNIKKIKYWEYPLNFNYNLSKITPSLIEEGTEKLKYAIQKYFIKDPNLKIGVTLSGGLDSRTICAFGSKIHPEIHCFHIKLKSKEAKIAHNICKKLGLKWRQIEFKQIDWNDILQIGSYLSDSHLVFSQFWLMGIIPYIKNLELALDGAVIDVLLKPLFVVFTALNEGIFNYQHAFKIILKKYYPLPSDYFRLFLLPSYWSKSKFFVENVIEHFKKFPTDDLGALSQYFYFTTRGRRFVWSLPLLNRNFVEVGFPGFDYDMFDFGTSLPINLRMEANLYRKILLINFPELKDIPWAKTGLPLTKYQSPLSKLKNKIKSYNYYIEKLTRYKFSFDKENWGYRFAHDHKFRQPFLNILLDKRTSNRGHVTEKNIRQLIEYQQKGKAPFSLIERLATIEMFYRMFMD